MVALGKNLILYISGYRCSDESKEVLITVVEPSPVAIINGKLCRIIDTEKLGLSDRDIASLVLRCADQDPILKELIEERKREVLRYA